MSLSREEQAESYLIHGSVRIALDMVVTEITKNKIKKGVARF